LTLETSVFRVSDTYNFDRHAVVVVVHARRWKRVTNFAARRRDASPAKVQSNLCVPPQDSVEISTGIASPGKSRSLQRNDIIMSTLKVASRFEQRDRGHAAN
jgi:hypothetical protein